MTRFQKLPLLSRGTLVYGVVALGCVWVLKPFPLQDPILVYGLLLGYLLCVAMLAGVGLKQLWSGAQEAGFRNLAFAALVALLGCGAFYLISVEASKWL